MDRDATRMRAGRPFLFAQLKHRKGVDGVVDQIARIGGLPMREAAGA
jgi:urease accessory protein